MTSEPRDRSQQPAQKPVFLLGHGNAMQETDGQTASSQHGTDPEGECAEPANPPPPPPRPVQTGAAYLTVPLFTDLTREQELQEQVPQP